MTTLPCPNEDFRKKKLMHRRAILIWALLVFKGMMDNLRKIITWLKKRKYPRGFFRLLSVLPHWFPVVFPFVKCIFHWYIYGND
jgi:hypothetical protein